MGKGYLLEHSHQTHTERIDRFDFEVLLRGNVKEQVQ